MHLIWARNMILHYIAQFQIELNNFTGRKVLFPFIALKSTFLHFVLESQEGSGEDLWNSLQAELTITKLTEERSMTTREKDRLKHELVSNSRSRILFSIILFT